ncbi:MAG: helix-turn-helix transcriptional regulator [Pseudomonadota bacterium]|nr:helix-turn-helix transcriptional regulator [Pseudomonadota bacterium]
MSLLAGRLFDAEGHRLTPSHAVKGGKRYRYYVSQALTVGRAADVTSARRIPAGELEQLVMQRLQQFFEDRGALLLALDGQVEAADALAALIERATALSVSWPTLTPVDLRALVMSLVKQVSVHAKQVHIEIVPASLQTVLTREPGDWPGAAMKKGDDSVRVMRLNVSATLKRAGIGTRMVVDGRGGSNDRTTPDPTLMNMVVKAHDFQVRIMKSRGSSLREVARAAGITPSYFTRLLRLSYLAPDITRAIVQGSQPPTLTARALAKASRLPLDWDEQQRLLGFD